MGAGSHDGHPAPARVEVLGPLRLVVDEAEVDVPGPKRRALLALLALAQGRTVTTDDLVEALWPAEPPGSARQAVHTHVSRLRGHLGPAAARLRRHQDGYRLDLGPTEIDLGRARALLRQATAIGAHDPSQALALLRQALELWRGPALADLTDVAPVAAAVQGFERLRQQIVDALVAFAVQAGQAASVADLAAESAAGDPLREPATLLHMRVLAAIGHPVDALRIGREYRHRLADETGLDPSAALGELERKIAAGDAGGRPAIRPMTASEPVLPAGSVSRLVGREVEVQALLRRLARERLVTIVGPGGVGKTRVALEVARSAGGPTVLRLASVTDPAALPHVLASALELDVVRGDVLAACLAVLGDDTHLVVIDNCEHLLDAVRDLVAELLSSGAKTSVLTTSREPLGLAAEYVWRLAPLATPPSADPATDDDLDQVPSVALFMDRADRVRPGSASAATGLQVVADVVRRLDGMPLAIELAAGRLSTLSLTDLHARLDRSLDLLGDGRPSADRRHRTLRATVAWSYDLLTVAEQRVFRYLSVFPDGIDLTTAENLVADVVPGCDPATILARLVDASMVDVRFEAGTRFRMLQTLRAYGLDRLATLDETADAARRLVRWAVDLALWIDDTMLGEAEPEADATLRREMGNLRAAWQLARDSAVDIVDEAVAMLVALIEPITYRDLLEIRSWADELADDPRLGGHRRACEVFGVAAEASYHRGDLDRAERLARAGLALDAAPAQRSICLQTLSVVELARGQYRQVVQHALAAAALTPRARDAAGVAALATAYAGDVDGARRLYEAHAVEGRSPSARAWAAYVQGELDSLSGHGESAEHHYLRAIELARSAGSTFLSGIASVGLLAVRARTGRIREALLGYRDVVDYFARTGNWTHLWATLRNLADLLRRLDDAEPADLIDASADAAPDAPALGPAAPHPGCSRIPGGEPPARSVVLDVVRQAIERNLKIIS